jgi:tRNA ligase
MKRSMDISEDLEQTPARDRRLRAYKPTLTDTKQAKQAAAKAHPNPRYFGLLLEIDVVDAVDAQISRHQGRGMFLRDFWESLKTPKGARGCVTRSPYVTIIHSKALRSVVLWERCTALHALAAPPMFCALWGERAYHGGDSRGSVLG